ncbi:SagB family peptide dehydrogenase [Brevibacillus choshinensis]|uniref:SagB family peptide dehydrogenase n=1 Tax=Brevibacillus choshinensis TaxID=54911 RepID=UPI002E240613|nr:SagB family peptide dehydrogenase [Brevibacillus choshinensis]MED4755033.1 SagB family peptide dehydrogenase [Brevibacillus choshinensis]
MSLEAFLHELHFVTDKAKPVEYEVDWEDAPLSYKLYRGLPAIPLSSEVPLTLEDRVVPAKPDLYELGHFLWYVFGLTQFSQSGMELDPMGNVYGPPMQSSRRFVPSGGGLYPSELYVYLKMEQSCGIYHYDVAHHRLVLLREGNFDSYVARALGNRCDVSRCFATVFVSTMYWKNYFKYHNFAYRLQGLDAGVVIGQMLEVAKRFGYAAGVYFQFLDQAVHHLLGVSELEEGVYAVIPLSVEPGIEWFANSKETERYISSAELCEELETVAHEHYVRSRKVKEYPMLIRMNEASRFDSTRQFRSIGKEKSDQDDRSHVVALPPVKRLSYDFASVCRKRYSPERDFVLGKVGQEQLAALLHEVAMSFPYRNDLDAEKEEPESRVSLYGCLYNVEGITDGAYHYNCAAHALQSVRHGDHRLWLQYAMSLGNVNLIQVPMCFHVAGDHDHLITALGYRGYRVQQMEAGMLVQRLLLAATAMGWGGHPLLGYDVNAADELYQMASLGKTSLIQIPVGAYRHRPRLQGSLHS